MTWLVLVLPATFAEAVGLSLKNPGSHGYLVNQIFIGIMYTTAFVFGMYGSPALRRSTPPFFPVCHANAEEIGWYLRAYKLEELDEAHCKGKQITPWNKSYR